MAAHRILGFAAALVLFVPIAANAWYGTIYSFAGLIGSAFVKAADDADKERRAEAGEDASESDPGIQESKGQVVAMVAGGLAMGALAAIQVAAIITLIMGVARGYNLVVGTLTIAAVFAWLAWIDDVTLSALVVVSLGAGALTIAAGVTMPKRERRNPYPPGYDPDAAA